MLRVFDRPFIAAVNHLLAGASWAGPRLAPFAGRTLRIAAAPFVVSATVDERGYLVAAQDAAAPAVTLAFAPSLLPRLLAGDEAARREVQVDGDPEFAAAIAHLFAHLRWDIEDDLAGIVGDLAARRIVQSGEAAAALPGRLAASLGRSAAHYWTHEDPLIASREAVAHFVSEVDTLRDDLARLAKRIERLEQAPPARSSAGTGLPERG